MAITKQGLMDRLLAMPGVIAAAELTLIDRQNALLKAQAELQMRRDGLFIGVWDELGMKIDGKNAETREAQMRQFTTIEQNEVIRANEVVIRQRHEVTTLQNEFVALRAVVDLLKGAA